MGKIILEDIEVYAYHGHLPEEHIIGSRFLVNLELDISLEKACRSDLINDTFNYQIAYDIVRDEMKQPSALLEHVAMRIADRIIKTSVLIRSVKIKVSKMNPPLGGNVKAVAVELIRGRTL